MNNAVPQTQKELKVTDINFQVLLESDSLYMQCRSALESFIKNPLGATLSPFTLVGIMESRAKELARDFNNE